MTSGMVYDKGLLIWDTTKAKYANKWKKKTGKLEGRNTLQLGSYGDGRAGERATVSVYKYIRVSVIVD